VPIWQYLATIVSLVVLGPGVLAPADPGVLEDVQDRRIRYGWGLEEEAGPGVMLIATERCDLLGARGVALVEGVGVVAVAVVDCQQKEHVPLSDLGIVADVSDESLGHRKAQLILWQP